jgi:3-hydroxyisobutyrate dehydrogenase
VDAPVSGGVAGAEAAKLTTMVGGSDSDVQRARPVLEAFAATIVHCGGVGAGHAVKAANQALLAIHIWSAGEVLAALTKSGVQPALALQVINASSGRSNASQNLIPERVLTRAFPRTFRLALLEKDVRIALDLVRQSGTAAPFTELAARLFAQARSELGEAADHVEAIRVIEREAGTEISD